MFMTNLQHLFTRAAEYSAAHHRIKCNVMVDKEIVTFRIIRKIGFMRYTTQFDFTWIDVNDHSIEVLDDMLNQITNIFEKG